MYGRLDLFYQTNDELFFRTRLAVPWTRFSKSISRNFEIYPSSGIPVSQTLAVALHPKYYYPIPQLPTYKCQKYYYGAYLKIVNLPWQKSVRCAPGHNLRRARAIPSIIAVIYEVRLPDYFFQAFSCFSHSDPTFCYPLSSYMTAHSRTFSLSCLPFTSFLSVFIAKSFCTPAWSANLKCLHRLLSKTENVLNIWISSTTCSSRW